MTNPTEPSKVTFTRTEFRAFRIYAVVLAAIAAGMVVVAPRGLGQVLGVGFVIVLLPVPVAVTYLVRRRRGPK